MTKLHSSLDVAVEMWRDLEEFGRFGSKETFRKQLFQEFMRRSGAATLDEAVTVALVPLVPFCETTMASRRRGARSPKPRIPDR
jgi:hypothetical protein